MISPKYFLALAGALFISFSVVSQPSGTTMDRDLAEVTITRLHEMYATRKYTVTEVTQWYLDRIAHYDSVYKAVLYVNRKGALAPRPPRMQRRRREVSASSVDHYGEYQLLSKQI